MRSVEPGSGWLRRVRRVVSPNHDPRPAGVCPELIVVHGISLPPGRFGGPWIDRLFTNTLPPAADPYFATLQALRVSAHLLIGRDGRLTQYVPFEARAWHAGRSSWGGREECNDFSIGIELEGTDDRPYTARQYRALARVIAALQRCYPLLASGGIAGHRDIAPGRRSDPGPAFDWRRLERELRRAGARFHPGLPA
ncbi:MAG: 1,6-anhydro-N-acetylmuramyl-L-alanine amidase AmpD [Gammaproteobacteria bacterium]|nr:1,6-anhydro-N-acetylmuramyl-L-alanine amidase AmpD [Gammaproteobacteria bacterium]